MPISELLVEGVNLMLLGLASVFIFLSVLVVAMNGMSRLAAALSKDESKDPSSTFTTPRVSEDSELVAVISAAISRYRSSRK
jgi:oxaloacetate decarboxylase gamma subunit